MRVAIFGASGLIGSALRHSLEGEGHAVVRFVRRPAASEDEITWNPAHGAPEMDRLRGVEAVVNLGGASLDRRWTEAAKRELYESRVDATATLVRLVGAAPQPPRVFVCASAVGYYGDRGDEWLKEESPPGRGFLPRLCIAWEQAAAAIEEVGVRSVSTRFGIVLDAKRGALARMLPPFRLGLGGRIGDGRQYLSWITLSDAVRAIRHVIGTSALRGPVNVTSPNPVTNAEFARTLGRLLRRPALFGLPAWAARLAFGEMADEALLAGTRVKPAWLPATGFEFEHPTLDAALRAVLSRGRKGGNE